jgi:hypothetical protein
MERGRWKMTTFRSPTTLDFRISTFDLRTPMLTTLTITGPIATLTLNRPDARNALSLDMIAAMEASIRSA